MTLPRQLDFLAVPERFMAVSRWLAPTIGAIAVILLVAGVSLVVNVPPDYQQSATVLILFVHIPPAWMSSFAYVCLAGASFLSLVFRQALADAAAKACAPLGAGFAVLTLATGSLWGRPMWGTWWVWDARLTSMVVLLLLYLGYIALRASIEDEGKASRAAAILALAGVINLPIIHYSVEWWNTLHQGATVFRADGPSMSTVYLIPTLLMALGYMAAFGALWLVRIRTEIWRRKARTLSLQAANR
jgi:heme exporter protein C